MICCLCHKDSEHYSIVLLPHGSDHQTEDSIQILHCVVLSKQQSCLVNLNNAHPSCHGNRSHLSFFRDQATAATPADIIALPDALDLLYCNAAPLWHDAGLQTETCSDVYIAIVASVSKRLLRAALGCSASGNSRCGHHDAERPHSSLRQLLC